jgi:ABC-2 type transport system permease protein
MKLVQGDALESSGTTPAARGFAGGALATLFVLTLRQHLRGRRLLILSLLFLLPSVLTIIIKLTADSPPVGELEFAFVFNLIPHVLATLTALLYAAGIVQDEVEGQTLTYLLLRPLPRWAIYITKLVATILVTSLLTGAFTALTIAVINWDAPDARAAEVFERLAKTMALLTLALTAYCSLFAAISLLTRRSLIAGIVYIIAFEGLLANLDFVVRRLTAMYYFRILAMRWFDPPESKEWAIDLTQAPSAETCMLTLLGASLVFTLLGAWLMMRREFHVKTPEAG